MRPPLRAGLAASQPHSAFLLLCATTFDLAGDLLDCFTAQKQDEGSPVVPVQMELKLSRVFASGRWWEQRKANGATLILFSGATLKVTGALLGDGVASKAATIKLPCSGCRMQLVINSVKLDDVSFPWLRCGIECRS